MGITETTVKARYVDLPWGRAQVITEVLVDGPSATGEPVSVGVAHLRERDGSELVRFFYRPNGRVVRGPLTLRASDRADLKAALKRTPELRALLREIVG
jgi:hypothetical protein